jgi:hypothetical protein
MSVYRAPGMVSARMYLDEQERKGLQVKVPR